MSEIYTYSLLFIFLTFVSSQLAKISHVGKIAGHWLSLTNLSIFGLLIFTVSDWRFYGLLNFSLLDKWFLLIFLTMNIVLGLTYSQRNSADGIVKSILFSISFVLIGATDFLHFIFVMIGLKIMVEFALYYVSNNRYLREVLKNLLYMTFENLLLLLVLFFYYLSTRSPKFLELHIENIELAFICLVLFLFWLVVTLGIAPFSFQHSRNGINKSPKNYFLYRNIFYTPIVYKCIGVMATYLNELPIGFQEHFIFFLQMVLIIGSVWNTLKLIHEYELGGFLYRCTHLNYLWSLLFILSNRINDDFHLLYLTLIINGIFPYIILQLFKRINDFEVIKGGTSRDILFEWITLSLFIISFVGIPFSLMFFGQMSLIQESFTELYLVSVMAYGLMGFIKLDKVIKLLFYKGKMKLQVYGNYLTSPRNFCYFLYFLIGCCVTIIGVFPSLVKI